MAYIAVLDSGVGGLTVWNACRQMLKGEDFLYVADGKRCPYGDRSDEDILRYVMDVVAFCERFPLKGIVVACNTATVVALEAIRRRVDVPVIGVVEPGSFLAAQATRNGRVGVLATSKTIERDTYGTLIRSMKEGVEVTGFACPWLAPLIEKGIGIEQELDQALRTYLRGARGAGVDTVVLGCTHYPFVRDRIQEVFGSGVTVVDPADETARRVRSVIPLGGGKGETRFYTSGDPEGFKRVAASWLGEPIEVEGISFVPT